MVHLLRLRQRARKGLLTRNSSQFLPIENIKRRRGEKGEGRRRRRGGEGEEGERRRKGGGEVYFLCLFAATISFIMVTLNSLGAHIYFTSKQNKYKKNIKRIKDKYRRGCEYVGMIKEENNEESRKEVGYP